ncbi:cytochrome P450 [Amycolatopsis sp. NPDC004378]
MFFANSAEQKHSEGFYALVRHADVHAAGRMPTQFSSQPSAVSITDPPQQARRHATSIINMDSPTHGQFRRLVAAQFTPRRLARLDASILTAVRQITDELIDRGAGDFVAHAADRLPLRIICDILGVPQEYRQEILESSRAIISITDPEYRDPTRTDPVTTGLLTATARLRRVLAALVTDRRRRPSDDLISTLAAAVVDGRKITLDEIASFFILLCTAGNDTTRAAIAHGLVLFTRHPDQKSLLLEDLRGRIGLAAEEIVRCSSPVIWMRRTATCDVDLNGNRYRRGDKVVLYYWSANRDERIFHQPERFNITRSPNPHLGFGGGPHFCLGAHLARREITAMFQQLFQRAPTIRADSEPAALHSDFVNGIKHVTYIVD